MRFQTNFATDDFLATLRTIDSNAQSGVARSFTSNLMSFQYSTARVDIEGFGMDINPQTLRWVNGIITAVRYFDRDVEMGSFSQLTYRVALGSDVASGLSGAVSLNGNDEFVGSAFADTLTPGPGNDRVVAGSGNDRVTGGPGNDSIDGGPGLDTAEFAGPRASFDFSADASRTGGVLFDRRTGAPEGSDTLTSIEYLQFSDTRVSLPDLALGSPVTPDPFGAQVYRFAKTDNGQYFYSGSIIERNQIVASFPNFRYEGPVFNAQDNWVTGYVPVYRFANLSNGGYFYTASAAERDSVFTSFPNFRYEGASFFVPGSATFDTVPVFRLANLNTGGYLFTTSAAERTFAISLGFWRDEGIAFNAPRSIALAADPENLAHDMTTAELVGVAPVWDAFA